MSEHTSALALDIQSSEPRLSLGYQGITNLQILREETCSRVETTTKVGAAIARAGLTILNEREIRSIKRAAIRKSGRASVAENWESFGLALYDFEPGDLLKLLATGAIAIGIAAAGISALVLRIVGDPIANDHTFLAALTGALTVPIIGLAVLAGMFVMSFTSLWTSWKFRWHKIPIEEYLPPLISENDLALLERLNAELVEEGISATFSILHGTLHGKESIVKQGERLTKKGQQLKQWRQETGLIQLVITFYDNESSELTLGSI